jgi:sucrose-6-phosphate hydrolase SacC (GH32 family)
LGRSPRKGAQGELAIVISIFWALAGTGPASTATDSRPVILMKPTPRVTRQAPDRVLADFEGGTYGTWKATGDAFGAGPAQGTLSDQMAVTGFTGRGLVNTFRGGDAATGTLTSPPFTLDRRYLRFLIGGGKDEKNLAVNLIVDGKVVRTATGPNDRPGGSEELDLHSWNLEDLRGKIATIEIVDRATGGWGHLNVDEIVLTDKRPPQMVRNATSHIPLTGRYLNLPVKNGARKRWVTVTLPGEAPRRFDIELADGKPDWWAFIDVSRWKGKSAWVVVDELREDSQGLKQIATANAINGSKDLYAEPLRPQLHFTAKRGWLNDPNGMVYYKGEYHLFYQHNPYGWGWGNMSWGHAVSKDLVHWKELPVALDPDPMGTMFSGSAVVDWNNTAGFAKPGGEPALVAMYTAAGKPFTQATAFSLDRGRTWTKYPGNPTIPHIEAENRDPKIVWYEREKKWVMSLYMDREDFAIFTSKDLIRWDRTDTVTVRGTSECSNFFPMPVDGDPQRTKWLFFGANGGYLIGDFDGRKFRPDSNATKWMQHGNCWYAAQVFSDIPASDGRTILIPWGQQSLPGMPFNQIMGLPVEMTLKSTPDEGIVVCSVPARELKKLRHGRQSLRMNERVDAGEFFEFETTIQPGSDGVVEFNVRGVPVVYDATKGELACLDRKASLKPVDGKIHLQVLVDRTTIDIFGNGGRLYMPMGKILDPKDRTLAVTAKQGNPKVVDLTHYRLKSIWR